ncbi:hypothetical protein [Vibrio vulnificus]|uniref:hypothetical protein n=1 Tax=Vibrio vulnificus TaxID=672 RepID=UPI001EEAFE4B|nr:hypothetical protein [Vibrio vulnificus]MCG6288887.1 hypothetical protein [Vibrio vulnificus]
MMYSSLDWIVKYTGTEGEALSIPVTISSNETNSDEFIVLTLHAEIDLPILPALKGLDKIIADGHEASFTQIGDGSWVARVICASPVRSAISNSTQAMPLAHST